MEFSIITSARSLAAITEEWSWLQYRVAQSPFADPALFQAWWDTRGRHDRRDLHIVTGRDDGKLMGLAPLVVTCRWGMRVLEWGGGELFDYPNCLLDSEQALRNAWARWAVQDEATSLTWDDPMPFARTIWRTLSGRVASRVAPPKGRGNDLGDRAVTT